MKTWEDLDPTYQTRFSVSPVHSSDVSNAVGDPLTEIKNLNCSDARHALTTAHAFRREV